MKPKFVLAAMSLAFLAVMGRAESQPPATRGSTTLTTRELSANPPIGELGLPLGTYTTIQATIFAGRELNTKGDDGNYLLRVTRVGDHARISQLSFQVRGDAKLAGDTSSLYQMKHGEEAHNLKASDIAELERGYVGKKVRLAGYETGGFAGIPQSLPPGMAVWQDTQFGFTTWFVVLAEK